MPTEEERSRAPFKWPEDDKDTNWPTNKKQMKEMIQEHEQAPVYDRTHHVFVAIKSKDWNRIFENKKVGEQGKAPIKNQK